MPRRPRRPGLVKAGQLPLITERVRRVWMSSDYRLRQMFEEADVMSEGAVRDEREGGVYYGTTSILLCTESYGGVIPDADVELCASLLTRDPHARVRAVRIACREAQVRSRMAIGRLKAEVFVHRDTHGIRFDVDVEAPVYEAGYARAPGERR